MSRERKMSHIKIIKVTMLLALLGVIPANAADVYIEQVGSSSYIDITQTGSGNRVGSDGDAATLNGTGTDVDVVQEGSSNELDIRTATGAGSTTVNITQEGDSNVGDINIGGATSTTYDAQISGSYNETTLCGTVTTAAASGTSAVCNTSVGVNDFEVDLDINGDSNKVAISRSGVAGGSNTKDVTVNIGGAGTASSNNIVNIDQSSTAESGIVNLTIDGSTNAVNITQE